MGRALSDSDSHDGCGTARARVATTAVHHDGTSIRSGMSVRDELALSIAKGCPAVCDGMLEELTDDPQQAGSLVERQTVRQPAGMDASTIEAFISVNVAQARQEALVKQQSLYHDTPTSQHGMECLRIQCRIEWFRS